MAEEQLIQCGKEAWSVWESTRSHNTTSLYKKGKRVWGEWCLQKGFGDGPLVRELKLVLFLKEYVLQMKASGHKAGINRPSAMINSVASSLPLDKASSPSLFTSQHGSDQNSSSLESSTPAPIKLSAPREFFRVF